MNAALPVSNRVRLDELLVLRGDFATRSRARDAIERGAVRVDGEVAAKAGRSVALDTPIQIDDPARNYVSRAALKLIAGLDHFQLDPRGRRVLDIGASTGGFTQVLLERGAAHVTAIDVGHGQLDAGLAADPRVTSIEGLNARDLGAGHLGAGQPDFLVCDVSFISLKLALPPALALAAPGARAVLLVKPQFEAGRAAIGKGGCCAIPTTASASPGDRRLARCNPGLARARLLPFADRWRRRQSQFLLAGVKDR